MSSSFRSLPALKSSPPRSAVRGPRMVWHMAYRVVALHTKAHYEGLTRKLLLEYIKTLQRVELNVSFLS